MGLIAKRLSLMDRFGFCLSPHSRHRSISHIIFMSLISTFIYGNGVLILILLTMYIGHCLSAAGMFLGNQSISDWIFVVDSWFVFMHLGRAIMFIYIFVPSPLILEKLYLIILARQCLSQKQQEHDVSCNERWDHAVRNYQTILSNAPLAKNTEALSCWQVHSNIVHFIGFLLPHEYWWSPCQSHWKVAAIASSIECDDHGAEYIEGRVKCILSDILKNPDTEMLKQFLPAAIESNEAAIGSQLLVQASLSAWQLGCAFHSRLQMHQR